MHRRKAGKRENHIERKGRRKSEKGKRRKTTGKEGKWGKVK